MIQICHRLRKPCFRKVIDCFQFLLTSPFMADLRLHHSLYFVYSFGVHSPAKRACFSCRVSYAVSMCLAALRMQLLIVDKHQRHINSHTKDHSNSHHKHLNHTNSHNKFQSQVRSHNKHQSYINSHNKHRGYDNCCLCSVACSDC